MGGGVSLFRNFLAISSVLATALCADGVSITDGDTPSLTIVGGSGTIGQSGSAWTSNSDIITWTPNNDIYTIGVGNNSDITGTALNLEISFNNTNTTNKIIVWKSGSESVAGIAASKDATSLTLDFQNKGLSLSGTMGLNINFGADSNNVSSNKTIEIQNLSTLRGNLTIFGGDGNNTFNVTVGDMVGDIIFGSGKIDADHGTITITNSLVGNITTNADIELSSSVNNGVKINFTDGATMTGSILGRTNGMGGLKKTITFSDSSTPDNSKIVLTGNIISYGPSSKDGVSFSRSSGNHVTFTKGSMVGSIIATNSPADKLTGKKGYNNITFASSSTQTLTGGILAYDYNNNGDDIRPTNTLTISANTTLQIKANPDESFNTITDSRTYGRTFTLSTGSIIARGRGANEINLANSSTLTLDGGIITEDNAKSLITFTGANGIINGNITTSGGSATITISNASSGVVNGNILSSGSGVNKITMSSSTTADLSKATITAGVATEESLSSGTNYLYLSGGATTIGTLSAISGTNYVSAETASTSLSFSTISASHGNNYIGKSILNNTNGNISESINNSTNVDDLMSATYAISSGTLKITSGVLSTGSGVNTVAFAADSNTNSTIIGANAQGTAISGNANIYLDVNTSGIGDGVNAITTYLSDKNYETFSNSAVIAGNITGSGSTNIKIIGTNNGTTTQIGILGNINNQGGTTNIVLVDSFFAPSEMIVTSIGTSPTSLSAPVTIGGTNAGNITTASGATTNIATRFTQSPTGNGYSIYNVNNIGSGVTNIALQGDFKIGANVSYGGSYDGEVNMIFASTSTATTNTTADSFTALNTNSEILGITYQEGVKLTLKDKSISIGDGTASFINTYGHYFTSINNGYTSTFTLDRNSNTDTITIQGLILGSLSPLDSSTARTFNVTIAENSAFVGSVVLPASVGQASQVTLTMKQGAKLLTDSEIFYAKQIKLAENNTFNAEGLSANTFAQNNTIIDLATMGSDLGNITTREDFRLFAVGSSTSSDANTGLQGNNTLFRVYVNDDASSNATLGGYTSSGNKSSDSTNPYSGNGRYGYFYSDRIIIADIGDQTNTTNTAQTHYLQIIADTNTDLKSIKYNSTADSSGKGGTAIAGNIAVATVKNGTNITSNDTKAIVTFGAQDVVQGFDHVTSGLIAVKTNQYGMTDSNGSGDWTTYFVSSMTTQGATSERGEASAATLATNYDLYIANFNSLNKRMGELRDNNNSQGAWVRIFNGSQTNEMGLGTKTSYTTFQGGYDYAIGMEGANNYIGLAVSYSMSSSKVQNSITQALNQEIVGFDNVKSNAVEVAIYNSYVQDEGWYNDSILKFSYIMSDFNIFNQSTTYNTSNMAFTLSDEFGYRFKLGSEKEWMIDPQLEVAFGYFNQSDFIQTLGLSSLEGVAEGIFTTRARLGSSFGYDFKKFTQGKGIKASVYVGAFYEYDYVTGGDIRLTTNLGGETTSSSAISSDGRVVMNVGTNVEIYDNTRIYFDFESSFAGKIRTDYQVNIGARYSFGESNGYTPAVAKAKEVAPLKVEEVKNTQENQAQESKTTQESK